MSINKKETQSMTSINEQITEDACATLPFGWSTIHQQIVH
eukprot:CAMPEP_0182429896 /NCGR_PEP_ID=MMETSP1167-20130531/34792_1 /TAXON_ID=2988 /ORGANISM="Mallomonas Sp, Strain CCMP3275" /LENGTH=39 /DNA_ID= /DNA_START= /DNA_END= /DNA_ORIENTATION=